VKISRTWTNLKLLFLQRDPLMIHTGVMSISAVLKKAGCECDILVENLERDFIEAILRCKPDAIGISCTTGLHLWAIQTARRIKKRMDIPIILGGPHPTFYADTISDSNIDIICIGEGEYPMLELAQNIDRGHDITRISNLWARDRRGQIHKNPLRPLIQDLDALPFMDRELYRKYRPLRAYDHSPLIITGRGCPYSCSFCFNKALRDMYSKTGGQYVRRRSIMNVIDEITRIKATYDTRKIIFMDDIFILDREWVLSFLESYRQLVALPFSCLVRADLITEPIVKALKDAGCFFVRMGIESGNERLRNQVLNKKVTTEQIKNAASLIKKYGIKLSTNSILGIPGETMDTALQTLHMNVDIRPDFAWCALMQPYPKTELAHYAITHGFLSRDFSFDDLDHSYFFSTPIEIKDKTAVTNLQKFFSICVAFPFLLPAVKCLAKLPPNSMFDLVFKLYYAYGTYMTGEINLEDYIRLALHSGASFQRRRGLGKESHQRLTIRCRSLE
jgi:anaerobic magnesium-protoporphyrin IX monomethyl ester cyclase